MNPVADMSYNSVLSDLSSELHAVLDDRLQIRYINPVFLHTLQYADASQLVQREFIRFIARTDECADFLSCTHRALKSPLTPFSFALGIRTQSGKVIELQGKIVADTNPLLYINAEIIIRSLEPLTRFRRFFDMSLLDIVMIMEQQHGKVIYANQGFYRTLHLSKEGEYNHTNLIYAEDAPIFEGLKLDLSRSEGKVARSSLRMCEGQGGYRWIECSMLFAKGYYYIVGNDVSDKKHQEIKIQELLSETVQLNHTLEQSNKDLLRSKTQLTQALEELTQRNYELDQFVYRVSHDIRSPLATILGLLYIIREVETNVENYGLYLDKIGVSVAKLELFANNLIQYLNAERLTPSSEWLDVSVILHGVWQELQSLPHASRLHLILEIEEPLKYFGDATQLTIIFQNIITNAIKYQNTAVPYSFLKIQLRCDEHWLNIHFEDNGIGIDKEAEGRLFQMFYRGTNVSPGSGLGLYIVRRIVDRLRGDIRAQGSDSGLKISLRLPHYDLS